MFKKLSVVVLAMFLGFFTAKADEGTLRKKYGISIDKNSVHGSDSIDNAKIEINFFFKS